MIFLTPLALLGLLSLPVVWFLLRATPPRPRRQSFPAIQILRSLRPQEVDASRAPLWLLVIRLCAVTLLVLGLARPVITGDALPSGGHGPIALVLDDDMLSAASWPERLAVAQSLVDDADHAKRPILLLRTAGTSTEDATDAPPALRPAGVLRQELASLRPSPWGTDRAALARKLSAHSLPSFGNVIYIANGVASDGDALLAKSLQALGPVQEIRIPDSAIYALQPAHSHTGAVMGHLLALPTEAPRAVTVHVHTQDGGTLAVVPVTLPAKSGGTDIVVDLPTTVRNRIDRLSLSGQPSAATTLLLDEGDRLRPVGLMTTGAADTPLIGPLFYLRRALAPTADLHEGPAATLLAQPFSVLIAPDGALADPALRQKVAEWVKNGGTLIRFAGPALAGAQHDGSAAPPADAPTGTDPLDNGHDALLPVALLDGSRQLGGTMTWGTPQKLAPFDASSPFHGLAIPSDVTISRQVLASPMADLSAHSWARLADGTPLVTHKELGKGEVILFHVSSTADWSNLPLSGLFVSMLQHLTEHANGVSMPADNSILSPVLTLDGDGALGPPPATAKGLQADAFATTQASAAHPPGLYGPRATRRALNAATQLHMLTPAAAFGVITSPSGHRPDTPLGRYCLLAALTLLLLDALLVLAMRQGLKLGKQTFSRGGSVAMVLVLLCTVHPAAQAQTPVAPTNSAPAPAHVPGGALETRLAYVLTGHTDIDTVSRQGLQGLSDYANARTSAMLGHPDGVTLGQDDLSYYPLLYWPITADAHITPQQTAALTAFMAHGGILLIDTQGQDSGNAESTDPSAGFAGDAPGSRSALRRVTNGLPIPPLSVMTDHHLLAHTFYMLHDFPGRYAGQNIWVAREGVAENDDVSPVIIGSGDWAHAWAVDENGNTPYAVIPGGAEQRQLAYRFGVNAVIYALTGNYKADQVHVPMLLKRLGE
ncbi:DUF4159 domain-containing protein [Acetobacter sp.]|uniref:DUF4159 domain-containing protein n=1 Tax=Acetobacter sp. TaxID=440 RepID=UPI0039ECA14C